MISISIFNRKHNNIIINENKIMKTVSIIQARMSSQRLPKKSLKVINGKPLLQYLIERLNRCERLDDVVVATSDDPSDDPIQAFCDLNGYKVFRGDLQNVANRFYSFLKQTDYDAFVRVNGDSPLIDQKLIDKGIELFGNNCYDFITNIFPRTFPPGQSVEVFKINFFCKEFSNMRDPEEFEHVTKYFYNNINKFKFYNFTSDRSYENIHLSIDTPEDMDKFMKIINKMDRPHYDYNLEEIVNIYKLVQ